MASGIYDEGKSVLMDQDMNAAPDLRLALLTNAIFTGSRTNVNDVIVTDGNTELSDTSYSRQVLSVQGTVTVVTTSGDSELRMDADVDFGSLSGGETIEGALLYLHVTNDSDSRPVAMYDVTGTTTNGGNIKFAWGIENSQRVILKVT